jgi:hypothetical protein
VVIEHRVTLGTVCCWVVLVVFGGWMVTYVGCLVAVANFVTHCSIDYYVAPVRGYRCCCIVVIRYWVQAVARCHFTATLLGLGYVVVDRRFVLIVVRGLIYRT